MKINIPELDSIISEITNFKTDSEQINLDLNNVISQSLIDKLNYKINKLKPKKDIVNTSTTWYNYIMSEYAKVLINKIDIKINSFDLIKILIKIKSKRIPDLYEYFKDDESNNILLYRSN